MGKLRSISGLAAVALWLSATATPSCADSWALPETTIYRSTDGRARIVVTPRDLENQLAYFEDSVREQAQPGQREPGRSVARARVERWRAGRWHRVWDRAIPNGVAPVEAIVRGDARYAATFDDWHGMGYGPNVIVLYGPDGKIVRRMTLSDILPAFYVESMSHSVSSIDWRDAPRFSGDGTHILLPIAIPREDNGARSETVDMAVAVADGAVSFPDPARWRAARNEGCRVYRANRAGEAALRAEFIAPLRRPSANDELGWHNYLHEAIARRFGDGPSQWTTVLRFPGAADYAVSEQWVRERLSDPSMGDAAIATLSEPNLVAVLRRIVPTVAPGTQKGRTLYIAVSARYWAQVKAALRPLGATLVQFDPDIPIAQRPERLARLKAA